MAVHELLNFIILQELINADERNRGKLQRRILRDSSDPFQLNDGDFIKYFRLSKNLSIQVIDLLRPHLHVQERITAVPIELKVLTALYFFGHGSYQKCVGLNFNLAVEQSTVSRIISEITNAMVENLLHQWIVFPQTEAEFTRIKHQFYERFAFPGVIGALDCTHVAIISPPTEDPVRPGIAYYNRKGYHSINVQIICDANLKILNCNARFPGSVHDSAIWALSSVKRNLQEKFISGQLQSSWLICDSGYPLQPWLLTPIVDAQENTPEGRYTRTHISARNCVERCIGVLKQRFRCLEKHRTLHYDPVIAGKIIYSCAILHNMAIDAGVPIPNDSEDQNRGQVELLMEHDMNDDWLTIGRRIRNNIIRQYFN